jgi:opacity protein-like surface antigen
MKNFLIAASAALLLSAGVAQADSYISVLGGPVWTPDLSVNGAKRATDTGFNAGARVGYGLDDYGLQNFSVEADAFHNESRVSNTVGTTTKSSSIMGNLIYHADFGLPFGIYGGAGIGAVNTRYDTGTIRGSGTELGWQGIGGVDYKVSPEASLFAEYRYQNAHDATAGVRNVGNTSNNLSVGVKFGL